LALQCLTSNSAIAERPSCMVGQLWPKVDWLSHWLSKV